MDGQGRARFSVSGNGLLVYGSLGTDKVGLMWVDREGKRLESVGEPNRGPLHPQLSPNEKQVAFKQSVGQNSDIRIWDFVHGLATRFTFQPAIEDYPVWSPDGSRIAFSSNREEAYDLYVKDVNGAGQEELLLKTRNTKVPSSWAANG